MNFLGHEKLGFIRNYLSNARSKGCKCPACGQYVRSYKRMIHSTMAFTLIKLFQMNQQTERFYHIKEIFDGLSHSASAGDFAKLQFWGFIEHKPNEDDETKKESGMWKITEKGKQYVRQDITAFKYVELYNNEVLGWSSETATISEALGSKFNYSKLMNPDA